MVLFAGVERVERGIRGQNGPVSPTFFTETFLGSAEAGPLRQWGPGPVGWLSGTISRGETRQNLDNNFLKFYPYMFFGMTRGSFAVGVLCWRGLVFFTFPGPEGFGITKLCDARPLGKQKYIYI